MKYVKKLICCLLVFCMTVSMLPLQVFAEDITDGSVVASGICGDNLTWTLVDGILTISGEGWMDEYSGNNNAPWYAYRSDIKTVDIEDGVESIGMSAFSDCDNLTEVVFSETVGYIGPYAFKNCVALTNIDIPAKVQYVNMGTFLGCTSLQNVSIPNSVTGIGYEAFRDCESLASLALPDSVTIIEDGAFYYCTSLESIYIPDSVTNMKGGIFNGCASLKQITIPEGTTTVGNVMFAECISLESVDIPSTISLIDTAAFMNCQSLSNIEIPNNVEKINDNAFDGCTSLKDVYYAGTEVQWNTITIESGNTELVDATIHYSGSDSDDHTHSYVSVVTNPTCTESGYTTYTCSCGNSYTDDYLAANGHEYGNWYETKAPTQEAESEERRDCESCDHYETRATDKLPEDSHTHQYTSAVTAPTCTERGYTTYACSCGEIYIDNYVDAVNHNFGDWYETKAPTQMQNGEERRNCENCNHDETRITDKLPSTQDTDKNIGGSCGDNLSWTFADGVLTISGEGRMDNFGSPDYGPWNGLRTEITSIVIGEGVSSIGKSAFNECWNLQSVTIPDTVTNIERSAFSYCEKLERISIPKGVTTIKEYVFHNCTSITELMIPQGVTTIGNRAFYGCCSLKSIAIPDSVTTIGPFAFTYCTGLSNLIMPFGVTKIGDSAFANCVSLKDIVIPDSVTTVGERAFEECKNLTSVTISEGMTTINSQVFRKCQSLTNITIPKSVTTIEPYAFEGCDKLTDVYYAGTENEWHAINKFIPYGNGSLVGANIHYNDTVSGSPDGNIGKIPEEAQVYSGSYYNVYRLSGYTWSSAKEYCESLGGHLATITSAEEQAFVESLSGGNTNLWIGGYRDEAFNWHWVTGEEWEYANWGSNQPDNSSNVVPNENCLAIWPKLWNDLNENNTREQVGFICEWETEKLEISGTCGTNLTWKLADGLLTITGEGAIPDYASNNLYGELAPWYEYRSEITKIEIGAGITSIGKNVFYSCTEVKTVVIPDGISSIAYGAFTACTGLRAVEIPASVTLIDDSAFFLCINLEDVYFTGTEEEWAAIELGENNFEDVTIHYNSKLPENAADSYPDDTDTPDYSATTQEVKYLRELGENDGKQYAAFGGYQEKSTTYYDITEETDTAFLDNKWEYLNNYVLVTSQKRPDAQEGNRILLSAELVKTGIDVISEVSVYGKTITIGDQIYPVSENVYLNSDFKSKTLVYYMLNGKIIGLENLSTIEGTLCYYDANSIEIIVKGYGGAKQIYRLYGDVAENAKDLLEGFAEAPVYVALDHCNGVVHRIRTWDGESYYSVYKTEEERAKALQIEREFAYWNQKYQEYLNAVENVLHTFSGIKEETRENFIADNAEGMKNSDYISNDALLGDYKMLTYRALATFFLDCMCTTVPNFSALDYSDENLAVSIANKIIDNINSEQRVYTFEDITVEIVGLEQFGYAYGTITVYTKNKNPIRTSFSMPHKECAAIIKSFIDELEDIAIDVTWNVATAVCDDLLGVLVNENLSSYSEKKVQDIFNKIGEKYNVVIYNELKKLDVGNLEEVLNICYSFYKEVEEALEAGKKGDISKIVSYVNGSKYETLLSRKILDDVNDAIVSEAMNTLNAAAKSLNNAFKEYLEDNTVKTKYSKNRINCPVNVAVYNSSGVQVGYVGDDDLWYTDAIHIDKFGDSKEIISLTNDALSFMITATDFGTMSCSFEEYDDTFAPVGRLNYYDIALAPEQIFCVTVLDNLAEQMDSLAITSNNESIYADEYVPVDNNAYAIVSCKLESGNESIGGSVTGTGSYVRGDAVVLISKPYDGFDFVGWFDGDTLLSTDRIFEFTVKEDRHLTARFFKDDYIRIDLEADAGGIVLGDGKYQSGETVSILAVPYNGYAFAGWYIEDELISAESEYSFEVSNPLIINAKFEAHEHIYGKPVFTWDKDNACTAIFGCTACDNVQTLDCTVTSTTNPATESEVGEIVYTAIVEFNGRTYTDTKTVTISATGHVTHTAESEWLSDDTQHWHKCAGCDEKLDVTEHSGGTATCTKKVVCEVCGTSYGELKPHEYETTWSKGDSNGHWHECKNCSAHDTAVKHTPGAAATETKAQACNVCGYVIAPAIGHTHSAGSQWYSGTNYHWKTCSCGEDINVALHSYTSDTDMTCNVCGKVRTIEITEPTEETEATVVEITEETEVTEETTVETSLTTESTGSEENEIFFGDDVPEDSDSKSSGVSGMLIVTLIIVMICSLVGVAILLIYRKRNKMN